MTGTVKKKTDKGFGFIARPDVEKDLFFHSNDLVGITFEQLQEGAVVSFDIEDGPKGPAAKNVKIADEKIAE
jgi:cold shock protein